MAETKLLPKYHPEADFFIADIFDALPFKSDMASMEHPFFSIRKQKDTRVFEYENGQNRIRIAPSADGLPTVFDKDILLYIGSLLMAEINAGRTPPRSLQIAVHDYLKATNRVTSMGGGAYKRFKGGLRRLKGCSIETTIQTGKEPEIHGFGLIEDYRYSEVFREKDKHMSVNVTVSKWFYDSLIEKSVLTISPEYFRLPKPIDRRIYELARKHCGEQEEWSISLAQLQKKCGSTSALKRFRQSVRATIKAQYLPQYTLEIDNDDLVTFTNRAPNAKATKKKKRAKAASGTTPYPSTAERQQELLPPSNALPYELPAFLAESAKQKAPRYDVYDLWEDFKEFNESTGVVLDDWKKAFLGFCRRRAERNPCP